MSIQMPITRERVKNHFHYHLWKYLVLVVLSVIFWNLAYTTTRYRVPDDRKVEFYAQGYQSQETTVLMDGLIARIHQELLPEMEEVSYVFLTLDETYAPVQLTVWASAGQGDVYLLERDYFRQMAAGGAMADLQPYVESGQLSVEGLSLTAGMVTNSDTGERVLCGIPTDSLEGLGEYGLVTKGGFLSILSTGGNVEESIQFVNDLLIQMREGK